MMRYLDRDFWPPLISVLVLVVCTGLLWAEYKTAREIHSGVALGRVVEAHGTLQRKAGKGMMFRDTGRRGRLRAGDTLRTSHASRAVVHLNNGIKITLGEFSMVVLTRSSNAVDLNLRRGSLHVRGSDANLRVRSRGNTLNMKQGEVRMRRMGKSNIRIEVRKGSAELTSGGRKYDLRENQRAGIQGPRVKIDPIRFLSVSPDDGVRILAPAARARVRFAWKNTGGKEAAFLELATDANFKTAIRLITAKPGTGEETTADLSPGIYYWRIRNRGGTARSETRFLSVSAVRPPVLLIPSRDAVFRRVAAEPRVDFAWIPRAGAADYTVEISTTPDFRRIAHSLMCTTSGVSLNLGPAKYYWRVRGRLRGREGKPRLVSAVRSFQVAPKSEYGAPTAIAPGVDARVSADSARRAGILFSWRGPAEIVRWEWSLAGDSEFKTRVQSAGAVRSYALLRGTLKQGISYWRVRGFDAEGRATPYSVPMRFRIVKTPAFNSIAPVDGAVIAGTRILFRWRTGGTSSVYRFALSSSPKMTGPLLARIVYKDGLDLDAPKAGRYFWRVEIVRNGRAITKGPVKSFTVPRAPGAPDILFPRAKSSVDMSHRDRLIFRWRPVKRAFRYRLRLYQYKGGKRVSVLVILTSRPRFALRDLSKLDIGTFAWSVVTVDAGGRESPERIAIFTVTLKNRPSIPRVKKSGVTPR